MQQSQLKSILINRELSWLNFNERVLITAEQDDMPLMERLKFLGIFSSNLDEFYSVRVGSLQRMLLESDQLSLVNKTEISKVIADILEKVTSYSIRVEELFNKVIHQLDRHNIAIVNEHIISREQGKFIEKFFTNSVRGKLFPIMLKKNRDFPFLKNVSIYLAINMYKHENPHDCQYALIEIPESIPRYIRIPPKNDHTCFIILDDIIRLHLKTIFNAFDYDVFEAYTVKITRDAEYSLDEEVTKSLYEKLSESIRQRSSGMPVRVVYDAAMPDHLWNYMARNAQLGSCENIISGGKYHNMRDFMSFPRIDKSELYFTNQPPMEHHTLDRSTSLIKQVMERDHLITLPYHRFGYIIDLLREAALDPLVTTIKMTLYRVAKDSSVINALLNAARNGKRIVVFIEIQARFNEEANLHWTETLSQEKNVTLISGLEGLKVHSKICVISRKPALSTTRGKSKNDRIAIISTGNFNEQTARLYSDHMLLTAKPEISNEVNKVFKQLRSNFQVFKFKHLFVSPAYLRNRITNLIKQEIANSRAGKPCGILLKLNNIVDELMIKWLCNASQAGVPVTLIVRGICAFIPGKAGISENIEIKAMIDRYLEHTRIYRFTNAGTPKYFIGSADLMPRNLDRRVETLTPISNPELKEELEFFLDMHMKDKYSTFIYSGYKTNVLLRSAPATAPEGGNIGTQESIIQAQNELYNYYTLKLSTAVQNTDSQEGGSNA